MASQRPNAPEGGDQSRDLPDWADRRHDISEHRTQPDSAGPGYQQAKRPERGFLRIYLGAAAGVGKTFAMLGEGHRRAERGSEVVVAFAETHGRPHTEVLVDGLEAIPRKLMTYRGATFEEMDLDAVLARHPQIALVDELAHTNVPGTP